jgi:hypothetical protein
MPKQRDENVTYAVADIGGGGMINGCYKSHNGQIRVIGSGFARPPWPTNGCFAIRRRGTSIGRATQGSGAVTPDPERRPRCR